MSNKMSDETLSTAHKTVLLHQSIDGLGIQKGDIVIDGTLGGGGHSEEIARRFGADVSLIGIDMDEKALARSRERVGKVTLHTLFFRDNFRNIDKVLGKAGHGHANRILLDIGLSSDQFECSGRGFSFRKDEPLLMTFGEDPKLHPFTAWDIVNEWEESSIADVIYGYGEERFARRIAKGIIEARAFRPIDTTFELVHIIEASVPFYYRRGKLHPATKTFQALRIAVNDELGALREGIRAAFSILAPKGRIAVISFHSLEDRIVKRFFKEMKDESKGVLVTKKAIVPDIDEIRINPRARSAKLRIIEKA